MSKINVSVIIPSYNSAHRISSALESVLNQSYQEWEMLVIDDGSTDQTKDIIAGYSDSRIRYIYQKNSGVSAARNTGIREAAGHYVAFLDADDRWFNDKLECQMCCMKQFPQISMVFSDFSASDFRTFNVESYYMKAFNFFKEYNFRPANMFDNEDTMVTPDNTVKVYWGAVFRYLVFGNFILPSSVLIKKDVVSLTGMFDNKYRVAEDTEFFLRVARDHIIAFIDRPLLTYCLPDNTHLSGKNNTERLMLNNIEILKTHLSSINSSPYHHFIRKSISRCFHRLSYYQLSVFDLSSTRASARQAIDFDRMQWRAYLTFMFSLLPKQVIRWLGKTKDEWRHSEGRR